MHRGVVMRQDCILSLYMCILVPLEGIREQNETKAIKEKMLELTQTWLMFNTMNLILWAISFVHWKLFGKTFTMILILIKVKTDMEKLKTTTHFRHCEVVQEVTGSRSSWNKLNQMLAASKRRICNVRCNYLKLSQITNAFICGKVSDNAKRTLW